MDNRLTNAYFNCAGLGPVSESSKVKWLNAERDFEKVLFSEEGVQKYLQLLNSCRNAIAELLAAPGPDGVVLLPNASTGLNIALNAIQPKPGEVVITSDQEHPAVEVPLTILSQRNIKVIPVNGTNPKRVEKLIEYFVRNNKVAMIVISHVSYKDGRVLPVEEIGSIARKYTIPYIVDGAQAVGQLDVSVSRIRPWVYVFSGHKWLFGPMGTGAMWVDKRFLDQFGGVWSSWASKSEEFNGSRFEGGTINFGLVAGFQEAIIDTCKHLKQRSGNLQNLRNEISNQFSGLRYLIKPSWTGEYAPGILTYMLPAKIPASEIAERLDRIHRVTVKPIKWPEEPNAIRISFSPWTSDQDVIRLTQSLRDELCSTGSSQELHRGHRPSQSFD